MQSWLGGKLLRWVMGRVREGDLRPILTLDAPDVQLTFPGQNRWAGVHRGKPEVRRWLQGLTELGIKTFADEVVVAGFPWRQTVCVRGTARCDVDGERRYDNRFVIWGQLRWGRLREYEVYEDTHAANQFDAWLTEHERAALAA